MKGLKFCCCDTVPSFECAPINLACKQYVPIQGFGLSGHYPDYGPYAENTEYSGTAVGTRQDWASGGSAALTAPALSDPSAFAGEWTNSVSTYAWGPDSVAPAGSGDSGRFLLPERTYIDNVRVTGASSFCVVQNTQIQMILLQQDILVDGVDPSGTTYTPAEFNIHMAADDVVVREWYEYPSSPLRAKARLAWQQLELSVELFPLVEKGRTTYRFTVNGGAWNWPFDTGRLRWSQCFLASGLSGEPISLTAGLQVYGVSNYLTYGEAGFRVRDLTKLTLRILSDGTTQAYEVPTTWDGITLPITLLPSEWYYPGPSFGGSGQHPTAPDSVTLS